MYLLPAQANIAPSGEMASARAEPFLLSNSQISFRLGTSHTWTFLVKPYPWAMTLLPSADTETTETVATSYSIVQSTLVWGDRTSTLSPPSSRGVLRFHGSHTHTAKPPTNSSTTST